MSERDNFVVHVSVVVTDGRKILLVQEAKQAVRGRWNLPGGHVEHGEPLKAAAERELREETRLSCRLDGLVGVYQGRESIRFAFRATRGDEEPLPGDEILAVRWMSLNEVTAMKDEELVSALMLKAMMRDLTAGRLHPLEVVRTGS